MVFWDTSQIIQTGGATHPIKHLHTEGCDLHASTLNTLGLRQMQTTFWLTNVNSLATVNYGDATGIFGRRRRLGVANVPYLHKSLWGHIIAFVIMLKPSYSSI